MTLSNSHQDSNLIHVTCTVLTRQPLQNQCNKLLLLCLQCISRLYKVIKRQMSSLIVIRLVFNTFRKGTPESSLAGYFNNQSAATDTKIELLYLTKTKH